METTINALHRRIREYKNMLAFGLGPTMSSVVESMLRDTQADLDRLLLIERKQTATETATEVHPTMGAASDFFTPMPKIIWMMPPGNA